MPGFDTNRFIDLTEREAKHLICSICIGIFDGAVKSGCEHTFCKSCVQQWIETNHKECPECRTKFLTRKRSESTKFNDNLILIGNNIFKKNLLANSMVSELTIKCDFEFNGCQQSMKLDSLSSHIEDCDHNSCTKCNFIFNKDIEHNCIELLMNDSREFEDKYDQQLEINDKLMEENQKQMNLNNSLKIKYENQLEVNNKLKEENFELKTKLESIEKVLQNKNNNPNKLSNNEYICNSIENIYFGTYKTTVESFEMNQDAIKFKSLESNNSDKKPIDLTIEFISLQKLMYCDDPSLRLILIKVHKIHQADIEDALGLNITSYSNHKLKVDPICELI